MRLPRRLVAASAAVAVVGVLLSGCFAPLPTRDPIVDVDDFSFASFDAVYTLGQDAEGRSTLETVETMVAIFPEEDQNRGLRRVIPAALNGHSTELDVVGVTNGAGQNRDFELERTDDEVLLTIAVPEGEFVHGEQTYVLTYRQRGVTQPFPEGDQFLWDVNGVGWGQEFARVGAHLQLTSGLTQRVVGGPWCWFGVAGSTEMCEPTGGEGSYGAEVSALGPSETLTIGITFEVGTFTD